MRDLSSRRTCRPFLSCGRRCCSRPLSFLEILGSLTTASWNEPVRLCHYWQRDRRTKSGPQRRPVWLGGAGGKTVGGGSHFGTGASGGRRGNQCGGFLRSACEGYTHRRCRSVP